jgi:SAM-dependent methyltransferase
MLVAMPTGHDPYYRPGLARAHHLGYGFHADRCAPGILALLAPVRARDGLVLELGCGSGLLTRYLTDAGHRVVATDASPAMLDLARDYAPAAEIRRLTLPGGLFGIDICDLAYGQQRRGEPPLGRVGDSWAVISAASLPTPDRLVRDITVFTLGDDGCWRRDDERHDNILIDTAQVPGLLAAQDIQVTVGTAFGDEHLPAGLAVLIGRRAP